MNREEIQCKDCLCHYTKGFNHECPPWMKALVLNARMTNKAIIIGEDKGGLRSVITGKIEAPRGIIGSQGI